MKQLVMDIYQAYQNWRNDDGIHMAASVSFFMAVSFFPLLLVLISVFGFVLRFTGWGQDARQKLLEVIADQTAPTLARHIEEVLANVQDSAMAGGPIGLLTLLLASMIVFIHFDDAMDRIWNIPRRQGGGILTVIRSVLVDRLRAFLMLFGIGIFVLVSFIASMSLSAIGKFAGNWLPIPGWTWSLATFVAAVGLNCILFTLIYKVQPKVPVRWRDAARGGLFASVTWETGRRLLAYYVIGSHMSVYGVVGIFVIIMLWIFYAMATLFLGAEYVQVFCKRSDL